MPASLEARRRAVVNALREVAGEAQPPVSTLERRLDDLSNRLSAVEAALLESVWERPAVEPVDDDVDERVSVPAVPLGDGRMSSVASRALFGH